MFLGIVGYIGADKPTDNKACTAIVINIAAYPVNKYNYLIAETQ